MLAVTGVGAWATRDYEVLRKGFNSVREYCAGFEWPEALEEINEIVQTPTVLTVTASAYQDFLERQNFKKLPVSVVLAPHFNRHGRVQNSIPPQELWKNVVPTLRVADRLARELGEKIHINSAYRSPSYNATCPGAAKWSQHLRNAAVDMWFESPSAEVAKLARRLRDRGLFRGGVGLYPEFTHIDTRGRNVDW